MSHVPFAVVTCDHVPLSFVTPCDKICQLHKLDNGPNADNEERTIGMMATATMGAVLIC